MKKFLSSFIAIGILTVLLFASGAIYTVREDQQILLTQFGKPVGDPITEAGLHFKIPFIQKVNEMEKRVLSWDGNSSQMPTRDKLYIKVDTFARWEISKPLVYFQKLRDERTAQSRLDDVLGSDLVVSPSDWHPSAKGHHIIAESLYRQLQALGLVDGEGEAAGPGV